MDIPFLGVFSFLGVFPFLEKAVLGLGSVSEEAPIPDPPTGLSLYHHTHLLKS